MPCFPCFLELAVPFNQPLQVLPVDGIVESPVLHCARKRPCKQEWHCTNQSQDQFEDELDRRENDRYARSDPKCDLQSITPRAIRKWLKQLNHDPDAGGS
jgi:hypothetical protein